MMMMMAIALSMAEASAGGITLYVPASSEREAIVVVEVTLPAALPTVPRVTFPPETVQFVGPVVSTPEVQYLSDAAVAIQPEAGRPGTFGLKFLALPGATAATFTLTIGNERRQGAVAFVTRQRQGWYSLAVLAVGVALLVLGWKMWQVQKKHPSLMSTRSLFMNYEALEKLRQAYFPESRPETPASASTANPTARVSPTTSPSPLPISCEPPLPSPEAHRPPIGAQTAKRPATLPEPAGPFGDAPPKPTAEIPALDIPTPPALSSANPNPMTTLVDLDINLPADSPPETVSPMLPPAPSLVAPSADGSKLRTGNPLSQTAARSVLVLRLQDAQGREFSGTAHEITIGRKKGNAICLSAAEVSRSHVSIRAAAEGGGFVVVPLATNNITTVNGERIATDTPLKVGDELGLGGTPYRVTDLRRTERSPLISS